MILTLLKDIDKLNSLCYIILRKSIKIKSIIY
jgi:hypothetical protein